MEQQILICSSQLLFSFSLTHARKAQKKKVTSLVTGQMLDCLLGFHDLCSYYGDHAQLQLRFVAGRICTSLSKPGCCSCCLLLPLIKANYHLILFCFLRMFWVCCFPALVIRTDIINNSWHTEQPDWTICLLLSRTVFWAICESEFITWTPYNGLFCNPQKESGTYHIANLKK